MDGFNWSNIPKEAKEKMFTDIWSSIDSPCSCGYKCPLEKYGLDCEKDNNDHCLVRDFIIECLKVK